MSRLGRRTILAAAVAATTLAAAPHAFAQVRTWTGGGANDFWNNPANWDTGVPDTAGESAVIGAPTPTQLNIFVTLGGLEVLAGGELTVGNNLSLNLQPTGSLSNAGTIQVGTFADLQLVNTVLNSGTIVVDGTGSASDLELATDVTITGGGSVRLQGPAAGINDNFAGARVLTNGAGHSILGRGNIGQNTIDVVNDGLIVADVAAGPLILDPLSTVDGFVNNGLLTATAGGTLQLSSGGYNNTNGTITAEAGSTVELAATGANIFGGTLATPDATGRFLIRNNTSSGLYDLTSNARIDVGTFADLETAGTLTNNGLITIDGTGSASDLELQANTTLTGNGTLVLAGAAAGINDAPATATLLTHGADHTIRGRGNIGQNAMNVVNDGLIVADVAAGPLILDPLSAEGGFVNNGLLTATGGGELRLRAGGYVNNTSIVARDGSTVTLETNALIVGGTLDTPDVTGTFELPPNANVGLRDVTSLGRINVGTFTDLEIAGTLTNHGVITINGTGSASDLAIFGATTVLEGTGRVVLAGTAAGVNDENSNFLVLQHGADHTIEGSGSVGQTAINIDNDGTIIANRPGELMIVQPASSFVNDGTLRADGARMRLDGLFRFQNNGVLEAIDGGEVFSFGVNNNGAPLANFNATAGTLTGGTYRAVDGVLSIAPSNFDLAINNATIELIGTSLATDIFAAAPGATPGAVTTSINFEENNGTLLVAGGHTLDLTDTLVFDNNGTLSIGEGSTFRQSGSVSNFINTGTGTLGGAGTLEADLTNLGGIISPGDSVGTLAVEGYADLTGGATLLIEIAGTADNDLLAVLGNLNLGTDDAVSVDIALLDGFAPADGEQFLIATAGSALTGSLGSISSSDPFYSFSEVVEGTNLFVKATIIPEPGLLAPVLLAGGLIRRRR